MQTVFSKDMITGLFESELKNRFLCEVSIDGEKTVCYVPSSCHLGNFLKLHKRKVLLSSNKDIKSRTRYSLFAMPYKKSYIILNTSMANRAVENTIKSRKFNFLGKRRKILAEYKYDRYKCDLFIEDTNTIIEIKSVISIDDIAVFPTVYSERSINQLDELYCFLQKKANVEYYIVSLNPYVKKIVINKDTTFYKKIERCMAEGLAIRGFTARYRNGQLNIDKQLEIMID